MATGCTIITQVCIVLMFCGRALVTERWAERGGREGGSVSVGTFHSPVLLGNFPLTLLLSCHLTTLLPYNSTTLQPYHLTTLPPYNLTTLTPYHLNTWPPDHQEKKCQWKKRSMSSVLLHVPAGDGVLLCSVHIIVLSYMIVAYYIIIWYINYQALIALIFFCITAMWWPFFLKFSKHCLYLNISLSFCSIYWCWSFCNMLLGHG